MQHEKYPDMYAPSDKSCVPQETVIKDVQLACAYVPIQKLCTTFTPNKSLLAGTAFPELYDAYGWESKYGY